MTVQCQYCHQQFQMPYAAPPSQPPQPSYQSQQVPQIVIMHTHSTYDDSSYQVANAVSWSYWMFRAAVPLVVLLIFAGSSLAYWLAGKSKMASSLVWDGTTPFQCDGNDEYTVTGVTANFNAGTAIDVGGNCHFTCTDCNIKAPQAIDVDGNGSVTIMNGTIIGTDVLADARGNAHVNISGNVTASGQVKQEGNARVNAPKPSKPPPQPAAQPTTPAAAAAKPPAPAPSAKRK
jgi:hypothetical protein